MKKIIGAGSRFIILISILLTAATISDGCKKSSMDSMTGANPVVTPAGAVQGPNEVWIQNLAFNPSPITVSAGTTVKWTNKDGITHTVTSNTGLFDSSNVGPNGTFSFTFTTAGSYAYHCGIHTFMTATVIVN